MHTLTYLTGLSFAEVRINVIIPFRCSNRQAREIIYMSFKTESKGKALIVSLVKPVVYLSKSYLRRNRRVWENSNS